MGNAKHDVMAEMGASTGSAGIEAVRDGLREASRRERAASERRERRAALLRRMLVAASLVLGSTLFETRALATGDVAVAPHAVASMKVPSMKVGAITTQPIGHYSFCKTAPDECRAAKAAPALPALTAQRWDAITGVNALVNEVVAPRTDFELHGTAELWSYPTEMGDCEDYVLLKRRMLIERGFAAGNLLITVVRKPDGEGHAVLTVRTAHGDFVLDNLLDEVTAWSDTPYRFLKRQASHHAGRWVDIEDGPATLVGSVE